jgi:hypothetical protein
MNSIRIAILLYVIEILPTGYIATVIVVHCLVLIRIFVCIRKHEEKDNHSPSSFHSERLFCNRFFLFVSLCLFMHQVCLLLHSKMYLHRLMYGTCSYTSFHCSLSRDCDADNKLVTKTTDPSSIAAADDDDEGDSVVCYSTSEWHVKCDERCVLLFVHSHSLIIELNSQLIEYH